ncbi:MAG: DivIVA domain-containing protein, partial [Chloroflexota bacterium]|nr:DivIVA domain-containing protein [Chloroflexota bacterium]
MADAGRPQYSTPLAADDMIGSLATRVRELSLRVAQLEGELEAARRRVAVYEDFDAQVQDSLSAALRASNQIRERARVSAEAIAEEARAQRPSTVAELDAMRIERDALRRAVDGAGSGSSRATSPAATIPMAEMRTAATEALRGVFKELVAEIRSMPQESARQVPVQTAVQTPAPPPARPDSSPAPSAAPAAYRVPPAQQPAAPAPPPASNITAAPYQPPVQAAPPPPA